MGLESGGATTFSPPAGQKPVQLQFPSCLTCVEATEVFVLDVKFLDFEPMSVGLC